MQILYQICYQSFHLCNRCFKFDNSCYVFVIIHLIPIIFNHFYAAKHTHFCMKVDVIKYANLVINMLISVQSFCYIKDIILSHTCANFEEIYPIWTEIPTPTVIRLNVHISCNSSIDFVQGSITTGDMNRIALWVIRYWGKLTDSIQL
jgi:hypothetical protein